MREKQKAHVHFLRLVMRLLNYLHTPGFLEYESTWDISGSFAAKPKAQGLRFKIFLGILPFVRREPCSFVYVYVYVRTVAQQTPRPMVKDSPFTFEFPTGRNGRVSPDGLPGRSTEAALRLAIQSIMSPRCGSPLLPPTELLLLDVDWTPDRGKTVSCA